MKKLKRLTLRIVFAFEIGSIIWFYFFGSHGLHVLWALEASAAELKTEIELLEQETVQLYSKLDASKNDDFYKEKLAREKLQLAYAQEELYLLPSE